MDASPLKFSHKCNKCGIVFEKRQFLKNHAPFCGEDAPYVCVICFRSFTSEVEVVQHLTAEHRGECERMRAKAMRHEAVDSHRCDVCLETFPTQYHLQVHEKEHRGRDKELNCDDCGLSFQDETTLEKHQVEMMTRFSPRCTTKFPVRKNAEAITRKPWLGNSASDGGFESEDLLSIADPLSSQETLASEPRQAMGSQDSIVSEPVGSAEHPVGSQESLDSKPIESLSSIAVMGSQYSIVSEPVGSPKHAVGSQESLDSKPIEPPSSTPVMCSQDSIASEPVRSAKHPVGSQESLFSEPLSPTIPPTKAGETSLGENIAVSKSPKSSQETLSSEPTHPSRSSKKSRAKASSASEEKNIKSLEPPKYHECDECGKGFGRKSSLLRHARTQKGTRRRNNACESCGKEFTTRGLTLHRTSGCGELEQSVDYENLRVPRNSETKKEALGERPGIHGRRDTPSRTSISFRHSETKREVFNKRLGICNRRKTPARKCTSISSTGQTALKEEKQRQGEKLSGMSKKQKPQLIQCRICEKTFTSKSHLHDHVMNIHEKVRRAQCEVCGKQFYRKYGLTRHLKVHSKGRGNLARQCEISDKMLTTKDHMTDHVRGVHEKIKNSHCELCGKSFYRKFGLTCHMRLHGHGSLDKSAARPRMRAPAQGVSPYRCGVCGQGYDAVKDLSTHVQRKHPDVIEKMRTTTGRKTRQQSIRTQAA